MLGLFTNRNVAVSIRTASIVLSSLITLWFVTGSQTHTGLNITRAQYAAALAKWNSLHFTDYEATVQHSNWGKWKIVVHVDSSYGNKFVASVRASYSHRIVDFESLDSEAAKLEAELYQFETVGGLFDSIANDFYEEDHPYGHWYVPSYYVVEFDETMGYPRSYTSINTYATVETRIENVQILK